MGRAVSKRKAKKVTRYHTQSKRSTKSTMTKITAGELNWDGLSYFILHNILSAVFMFAIISVWFLAAQSDTWSWIASPLFWLYVGFFIMGSIFTSLVARVFVYALINYTYKSSSKRTKTGKIKVMKGFWQFQKGINALDFDWLLSIYVSAILYLIGFFILLSSLIWFTLNPFWFFILTWSIFKIIVAVIVFALLRKSPSRRLWFFILVNIFIIISIFSLATIGTTVTAGSE